MRTVETGGNSRKEAGKEAREVWRMALRKEVGEGRNVWRTEQGKGRREERIEKSREWNPEGAERAVCLRSRLFTLLTT